MKAREEVERGAKAHEKAAQAYGEATQLRVEASTASVAAQTWSLGYIYTEAEAKVLTLSQNGYGEEKR